MVPQHIAIVMDGNGRWAQQRGLLRIEGHRAGVEAVRAVIKACRQKGIAFLSLFAFSSENWSRPAEEVEFLMQLFLQALQQEVQELHANGIRLCFCGERRNLAKSLQKQIEDAEELTANNKEMVVNVAVNYGGKWDIVQAFKKIARKLEEGQLKPENITEELINKHLSTTLFPDPDLFIRTSGEQRISNFFLWQLAYTELYFTNTLWPDFTTEELETALANYAKRQRRYGKTSAQITGAI